MEVDPKLFSTLSKAVLNGIHRGLKTANLDPISRSYLGMGPVPPEDCCPDLVAWVTNLRPWDASSPDTLQENRLLSFWGLAFDINVRVGLCFLEITNEGLKNTDDITAMTDLINQYGLVAYASAIEALTTQGVCGSSDCNLSITPLPMSPFTEGACAGWNITITVATI